MKALFLNRAFSFTGLVDDQSIKGKNESTIHPLEFGALGAAGFDLFDALGQYHRDAVEQFVCGNFPADGESPSQKVNNLVIDAVNVCPEAGEVAHGGFLRLVGGFGKVLAEGGTPGHNKAVRGGEGLVLAIRCR